MQGHSTRAARKRKTATLYRSTVRNDYLATSYGLEPFAAVLLSYADEDREPRDGERVFVHYARDGKGCGCTETGTYRALRGGESVIERLSDDDDREPLEISAHVHHYLMRVVGYVRDGGAIVWLDPEDAGKWAGCAPAKLRESDLIMSEEEYVAEFGQTWEERWGFFVTRDEEGRLLKHDGDDARRKAKLARLKGRLTNLNEQDEITTCSARMKLEREIFDLEHPINLDDWSAWQE